MGSKGKKRFKAPMRGSMAEQIEQLQKQMAEAQEALESATVVGSSGGGAVTVELSGTQELRAIHIAPEVVDPEDIEMLEDLILAAFREAQAKLQEKADELLGPLMQGGDLGLF